MQYRHIGIHIALRRFIRFTMIVQGGSQGTAGADRKSFRIKYRSYTLDTFSASTYELASAMCSHRTRRNMVKSILPHFY